MKIVILDAFTADHGELSWEGLAREGDELVRYERTPPAETVARCAGAQAVLTNKVPIDARVLAALPGLKYVGVLATGYNVVDVAVAAERGVTVTNIPAYSTASVAQLVMGYLLEAGLDVAGHSAASKAGTWAAGPDFTFTLRPTVELAGKVLAVVGLGGIGSAVARLATAFGLEVLAAQVPGRDTRGRVPLAEALARADYVSLHCPLTDATAGMVDDAFLGAMKPGAMLINTGRGPLLDDAAVVCALESGRLGRLAADVLATEPPPADHPFLDAKASWADRVTITPHLGWATVEARRRLVATAVANLVAWRDGTAVNVVG